MSFDQFWSLYPRKVSKRAAQKAWDKEMKAGTDPLLILHGLRQQLPGFARRDPQFIPHAATWIHQGRFEDEIEQPQRPKAQARPGDMADFTQDLMGRFYEREREYVPTAGDRGTQHALAHIAFKERH